LPHNNMEFWHFFEEGCNHEAVRWEECLSGCAGYLL